MAGPEAAKKDKKKEGDSKPKSSKDEKDKKHKPEDKDKKHKPEDKDKKHKPEDKDKKKEKDGKEGKDKHAAPQKGKPAPPPAPARRPPPLKAAKGGDDYLAGIDLPSTDSEGEEVERAERDDKGPLAIQVNAREAKKLADKERLLLEKAYRAREDAMREDDNVFDVAFEGMGDGDATLSATDIKVHSLTIRAKGKLLLENTSLTITAGRRYGLVGPNGRGKSTLLKLLARRQIPVPGDIDVLLVEQEVVGSEQSALQAVVAADVELVALRLEEAKLTEDLAADPHPPGLDVDAASARLNEVYEALNERSSATAESRASKILHGLGFTPAMQTRPTSSFSGGWRMRISLARALYIQPTLLLLDEPTNHLDLRAVLWLEEYLTRWKKTLVVVSHDRDFLNSVTTDIIHLHDLNLHFYRGNFAQFEEMYEQKRREVNKAFDRYEKQLKAAKAKGQSNKQSQEKVGRAHAQKVKGKAGKRDGMGGDEASGSAAANAPQKWSDYQVEFHFPLPTDLGSNSLMQLMDADFKYPGREDFGLVNVNIGIDMGSRVAIVGPNGAGKTTLMNLLSGDLEPTAGESRRSPKLRVGRYNQHFVDALSMDVNPVEYLMTKYPQSGLKPEAVRAILGKFGLSGHHHLVPIVKLSGGQKARVVFAGICLSQPHILLLDEPTNHLDMQSIDALCDAVEEFGGGVVVISHDAQLLSRLCADEERSQVWIVDNGEITPYDGDFEDYRDELTKEITAELDEAEAAEAAADPFKPKPVSD
ncbi:ABC transporter F family member [Raphidocelis subcapitata]|uniref:ABC transporter F family member n=1 Tax=Raphidocelis subcapitata TaxID=307507 RepID=A0A2V0PGU5_9CHLO|nr:ABC transporter F family member [Raphidocelis subcapitata]|eukprot:GBF96295.1 ABC transporter F family member [Raphidocelis subcapitata]